MHLLYVCYCMSLINHFLPPWKNSLNLILQVMKAVILKHKEKFFKNSAITLSYVKTVPLQKLLYYEKYRYNKWDIFISDLVILAMLL